MEDERIIVSTAYNVEIEYFTATAWGRSLSTLIDAVIKWGYTIMVTLIFINALELDNYVVYVIVLLPAIFYTLILEMFNDGKTVGKAALNLQVVSLTGKNTTFGQYIIRWMTRFLDFWVFTSGLAFISVASTLKRQRIGDILANTAVITQNDRTAHRSNLGRVKLPNGYVGRYREVLQLDEHHLETIKQVIFNETPAKLKIQKATAERIMFLTKIPKTLPSKKYLKMIIYDYNYFQRLSERGQDQEE